MKTTLVTLFASLVIATALTAFQKLTGQPNGFLGTAVIVFGLTTVCRIMNHFMKD